MNQMSEWINGKHTVWMSQMSEHFVLLRYFPTCISNFLSFYLIEIWFWMEVWFFLRVNLRWPWHQSGEMSYEGEQSPERYRWSSNRIGMACCWKIKRFLIHYTFFGYISIFCYMNKVFWFLNFGFLFVKKWFWRSVKYASPKLKISISKLHFQDFERQFGPSKILKAEILYI